MFKIYEDPKLRLIGHKRFFREEAHVASLKEQEAVRCCDFKSASLWCRYGILVGKILEELEKDKS